MSREPQSRVQQIAASIRSEIRRGVVQPGEKLPTLAEYMGLWGATLSTVRSAQALLADEGLVRPVHGVGVFVADPLPDGALQSARDGVTASLRALEEASRNLEAAVAASEAAVISVPDPRDRAALTEALHDYLRAHPEPTGPSEDYVARVRRLLDELG